MRRLLWMIGYTYRAVRSPYQIGVWDAWCEASASWDMNDYERMGEPMPTPADALYDDQTNWSDR